LRFNGSNSKAVLDGSYLDGSTHSNYSFEVWIKPFSLSSGNDINLLGKNEYWKGWWLSITPNNGLYLGGSWPYYYWGSGVGTNSLTTNVWQHVCCSVTNGQASFYINGKLIGVEAVQNPIDFLAVYPDSSAPQLDAAMAIGYGDSGTTPDYGFFNGLIYGIKVWSRTLSAGEVRAIATTGVPLSTNGLYNAVMLNEGSGSTINDSLTGLTGRVLTAQWSSDAPTLVTLIKAVRPSFVNLSLGTNYQLQVSSNMSTWTNQGSPFTATNSAMIYPQYFDVDNWAKLFFRVQSVP
jgi:hypothetical protein